MNIQLNHANFSIFFIKSVYSTRFPQTIHRVCKTVHNFPPYPCVTFTRFLEKNREIGMVEKENHWVGD